MLTAVVRADTGLPAPLQPFTDQILSELMTYAKQFDSAPATPEALENLNQIFQQDHRDGLVWNENETNFFKRWQEDAIPDPVNMPYPTLPDNEERNADPSAYLLRHPFGQLLPRF